MLGLSVIILFKSLLHVFCSLVFSAHNSSEPFPEVSPVQNLHLVSGNPGALEVYLLLLAGQVGGNPGALEVYLLAGQVYLLLLAGQVGRGRE